MRSRDIDIEKFDNIIFIKCTPSAFGLYDCLLNEEVAIRDLQGIKINNAGRSKIGQDGISYHIDNTTCVRYHRSLWCDDEFKD